MKIRKNISLSKSANLEKMFRSSHIFSDNSCSVYNRNSSQKRWSVDQVPILRRPSQIKRQPKLLQTLKQNHNLFSFTSPCPIQQTTRQLSTSLYYNNTSRTFIEPRIGKHRRIYSVAPRSPTFYTPVSQLQLQHPKPHNTLYVPKLWKALKSGSKSKKRYKTTQQASPKDFDGLLINSSSIKLDFHNK